MRPVREKCQSVQPYFVTDRSPNQSLFTLFLPGAIPSFSAAAATAAKKERIDVPFRAELKFNIFSRYIKPVILAHFYGQEKERGLIYGPLNHLVISYSGYMHVVHLFCQIDIIDFVRQFYWLAMRYFCSN